MLHDGRHRMKQLSAQSTKLTKLVVSPHEDGHSGRRKGWKRKEEDDKKTGNVLEVQCLLFSWCVPIKGAFGTATNLNCPKEEKLFLFACCQVLRGSSSSLLSFTLPPRLSGLACEWFLAETAAWTNGRWAKGEARLSFIQTPPWTAGGGWCIQIPRTLTGLFSLWRPWGEPHTDMNKRCCFNTNTTNLGQHQNERPRPINCH